MLGFLSANATHFICKGKHKLKHKDDRKIVESDLSKDFKNSARQAPSWEIGQVAITKQKSMDNTKRFFTRWVKKCYSLIV